MIVNFERVPIQEVQGNMIVSIESAEHIKRDKISFDINLNERVGFQSIKDELERDHLEYITSELREKGLLGPDDSLEDLEVEVYETGTGGNAKIILTYSKKIKIDAV